MEYVVVLAFLAVGFGGIYLASVTRKRREKRHQEEAARTDGTPFDPALPVDPNK